MTKICGKCKIEKDIELFAKRHLKTKGSTHSWCKECSNKNRMESYHKNIEHEKQRKKEYRYTNRKNNMKKIFEYLEQMGCIDCGEKNPIVLDFDHKEDKEFNISGVVHYMSWKSIQKEIEKCDVRCSNCHRIKTCQQLGWYIYMDIRKYLESYKIKINREN